MKSTIEQICFADSKQTLHIKNIYQIKKNKDDNNSISPEHVNDFDKKHIYYTQWSCDEMECEKEHEHFGYYPCLIIRLAGKLK